MNRLTFLITAGPTREPIDPVRYLTNLSSGKMGYAIAAAAAQLGYRVLLVSGPTRLNVPEGCDLIPVETALEMEQAVSRYILQSQIAVFCAAVADYRPIEYSEQKLKKNEKEMSLTLVRTPDILKNARREYGYRGLLVGFAAETEDLIDNARKKLKDKQCDILFANDVSRGEVGFDTDENSLLALYGDEVVSLGRHSKVDLGKMVVELCLRRRDDV